ncbi:MAG: hypothetical protein IJZ03_04900 [Clostridia bacterium]|nr:hypothetical protein [Clostridia bacterium]
MKKTISVLILLAMILTFTVSCKNSDADKKNQNNYSHNGVSEKRIFSGSAGFGESGENHSGLVSTSSIGLFTSVEDKVFNELNGKTRKFSGFNGEFVYQKSECTLKGNKSGEYGSFYSIHDVYKNDSHELIHVLHGTDIITFYSNLAGQMGESVELWEDDRKQIAENFLLDIISEDKFNEFTLVQNSHTNVGLHHIKYLKYIEGYASNESLSIFLYESGEIMGYNGTDLGKYDSLESKITKKTLDEARDALNEKLSSMKLENLKTYDPCIITNTEGKVFLQMNYEYTDLKGNVSGETIVTNVF